MCVINMDLDPYPPLRYTTARAMLAGGYTLAAYCRRCDRWADVDLARLVRIGQGDRELIPFRPVCRVCGQLGEGQLRPPVPGFCGPRE